MMSNAVWCPAVSPDRAIEADFFAIEDELEVQASDSPHLGLAFAVVHGPNASSRSGIAVMESQQ